MCAEGTETITGMGKNAWDKLSCLCAPLEMPFT